MPETSWLIIRIFSQQDFGTDVIQSIGVPYPPKDPSPRFVESVLESEGYILDGFGDPVPGRLGAVVYCSPNEEGIGRTGSQVWSYRIRTKGRGRRMKSYHPDDPKLVANWFDPHNPEHLRAWQECQQTGWWPKWFQEMMREEGIEPHQHWSMIIPSEMAELWVEHKTGVPNEQEERK